MQVAAVVMAGGSGERFWPRSRRAVPKQLLSISGEKSLLQETVDRVLPVVDARDVLVVTGENLGSKVVQQLPGIPRENIIIEPCPRSTAACIALAAAELEQRYGDPSDVVMIVLPSDHVVRDPGAFRSTLRTAIEVATVRTEAFEAVATGHSFQAASASRQFHDQAGCVAEKEEYREIRVAEARGTESLDDIQGARDVGADGIPRRPDGPSGALPAPLVTLGIWPTRPETGYGYIHLGGPLGKFGEFTAYHATEFIEKPDAVRAQRFLSDGRYLWNSGVFVWRLDVILRAFEIYMPALREFLSKIRSAFTASSCRETNGDSGSVWKDIGGTESAREVEGDIRSAYILRILGERVQEGSALHEEYQRLEPISIDYGILEKANPVAVIPCGFGWDDVGTWPALERVAPADDSGNVVLAHHIGIDTRNCILVQDINGNGNVSFTNVENGESAGIAEPARRLIATLGVDNLVIVETPDVTLVCRKDRASDVRALVSELRRRGWEGYL